MKVKGSALKFLTNTMQRRYFYIEKKERNMASERGKDKGCSQIDWRRVAKGYKQALKASETYSSQQSFPSKKRTPSTKAREASAN